MNIYQQQELLEKMLNADYYNNDVNNIGQLLLKTAENYFPLFEDLPRYIIMPLEELAFSMHRSPGEYDAEKRKIDRSSKEFEFAVLLFSNFSSVHRSGVEIDAYLTESEVHLQLAFADDQRKEFLQQLNLIAFYD